MNEGRQKYRVTVIGYGNELRGDDGLGIAVARAIDAWRLPRIQVLARHQLVPELAEVLADLAVVFFVDACLDPSIKEVTVTAISPHSPARGIGHVSHPRELLALCQSLYHRRPQAWWVRVPVEDVRLGEGLSEHARRNLNTTLSLLRPRLLALGADASLDRDPPAPRISSCHA